MYNILWATPGKAAFLVDGQFGSTGKGLIAAWLGLHGVKLDRDLGIATTNAGAQAGHTTKFKSGDEFVCFHMPTVAVVNRNFQAYVNAGSIVDPGSLLDELNSIPRSFTPKTLIVHPRAAIISAADKTEERRGGSSTEGLASTQKGVGSAISNKVMRRGMNAGQCDDLRDLASIRSIDLNLAMVNRTTVTVEVPQGLGLSLNHGPFWPYVTSRDCWMGSAMSDAMIHPDFVGQVAMVVRTFPIRVGHLYNEHGEKLGDSGPFYDDSTELNWEKDFPGIEPERTTVTKRVRRIATWSRQQYCDALAANRPRIVALTFCNYLRSAEEFETLCAKISADEARVLGYYPMKIYSFSPYVEDVGMSYDQVYNWLKENRG